MDLRFALIIPAAGSGKRLGESIPKPYLEIAGKTILEHTLTRFSSVEDIEEVVVSTSAEFTQQSVEILNKVFPGKTVHVVPGGAERQDSIRNALGKISENIELIAVHDAVRPFVDTNTITACFNRAAKTGGAIAAVPSKDTIKRTGAGRIIEETPDRDHLWQAQTPQVFDRKLLSDAYRKALEENFKGTDDASLVERIGGRIEIVEGTHENFKITYPVDLKLAELLLNRNRNL